jgi:hypothetical protein
VLRVLEVGHLGHHRERLDDEDAAHHREHDLLARDDGDRAERAAERERADVAHEDLRRMRVEPQEGQPAPASAEQKISSFARAGDVREDQVLA